LDHARRLFTAMKFFIHSPDKNGFVDGCLQHMVLDGFPNLVSSEAEADVCLAPVSRHAGFEFGSLPSKPYVILDFLEYEWRAVNDVRYSHFLGENTAEFERWLSPEWRRLCESVSGNKPIAYFKRELHASDLFIPTVHPIDWPCMQEIPPVQSEEEYNARPIDVLFWWGYSHPSRPRLHADIFQGMADHGIEVFDNHEVWGAIDTPRKAWLSLYLPWYKRVPAATLMALQRQAKITVSMPGAGVKCFRTTGEASVGSLMALPNDDMAWSYPWTNRMNCIRMKRPPSEFGHLLHWSRGNEGNNAYGLYVAAQDTIKLYQRDTYIRDYVIPIIERAM
jgi:hypothetical protein